MNPLIEWLGAGGKLVPQFQAEERGKVCEICPQNVEPKWWEGVIKNPIAGAIILMLEARNNIKATVSMEDSLAMCRVCGCCTKLKVHEPIEHIKANTTPEIMTKYPDHCWIPRECSL